MLSSGVEILSPLSPTVQSFTNPSASLCLFPGLQGEVNLDVEDGGEQATGDVLHTSALSIFSGLSVEASGLFSGSPLLGLLLTQTDRHLSYLRCTPT